VLEINDEMVGGRPDLSTETSLEKRYGEHVQLPGDHHHTDAGTRALDSQVEKSSPGV
jgi:hypothetical protein